jgi:signal transduction histidine kinase
MIAAGDKRRPPLEPGMRTMLRWMAVVYVCMAPLIQILGTFFANTPAPSVTVILLSLVVPLLLFAYVWMPRWEPIMGQAFVPVALLLIMINVLVPRTFVLIQTGPAGLESTFVLYGMLRTWMTMSLLVTALAWQYRMSITVAVTLAFLMADGLLSLPFVLSDRTELVLLVGVWVTRLVSLLMLCLVVRLAVERLRRQRDELELAHRQLAHYVTTAEQLAVSEERNRLAREMHDTLAHSLSAITLHLEAVQALWETDAVAARAMVERATQSTRAGLSEARRAMRALRAGPLEEMGLVGALAELARTSAALGGLELVLELPAHVDASPAAEQSLYRVAQESMTNVMRHASAHKLHVRLCASPTELQLMVADDGSGFVMQETNGAGFGLRGLQERIAAMGGVLRVESAPEAGTSVRCTLPSGQAAQRTGQSNGHRREAQDSAGGVSR